MCIERKVVLVTKANSSMIEWGDNVNFFFWNLDNRGKFIRSLWSGALALLFLYGVVWFYAENFGMRLGVPITLTLLYIVDVLYRYRKWKNGD